MKTVLVLLVAFALSGCSNTSIVRVVELGGGGAVGALTGAVGDCAVHQKKDGEIYADVKILYRGIKCTAIVDVKAPTPTN